MDARPAATILLFAEYGGRTAEDAPQLGATLEALAAQDFAQPFEVLLVDATPGGAPVPPAAARALPGLRVLRVERDGARAPLDLAVAEARSEAVFLLDADCTPVPGWLAAGMAALDAHPDAVAVSGLTVYPGTSFRNRVLGALSRSFVDPGGPGRTRFITPNNALLRRAALLRHPQPAIEPRALAARLQMEAIRRAGGGLYFEPAMRVAHRFAGWPMERRIRRSVGYRALRVRQLDPDVAHAWIARLGVASIPLVLAARTLDSFRDCLRAGRHYGLRRREMPAAFAMAVVVHLLELGGMAQALAEARADGRAAKAQRAT